MRIKILVIVIIIIMIIIKYENTNRNSGFIAVIVKVFKMIIVVSFSNDHLCQVNTLYLAKYYELRLLWSSEILILPYPLESNKSYVKLHCLLGLN